MMICIGRRRETSCTARLFSSSRCTIYRRSAALCPLRSCVAVVAHAFSGRCALTSANSLVAAQRGEQRPKYDGRRSVCHEYHREELSGLSLPPNNEPPSSPSFTLALFPIGGKPIATPLCNALARDLGWKPSLHIPHSVLIFRACLLPAREVMLPMCVCDEN